MKILILGGYGVFGGRLARLLLEDGAEVLVAGLDSAKAAAFTRQYGGSPLRVDIARDLSPIADAAPGLVVDAAGPFQAYGGDPYRVARFCVERGINYLDFSDDAAFTAGITALDGAARAAGSFALSGVSTVPAISAAAVRALGEGFSEIAGVETALMPGNRAPRGRSVIRSILAQAGEPLRMWRGGAWRPSRGWADAKRLTFGPGLKRWASLIGAPDLTLFPQAFGARSVVFRAGLELGLMHWGLALLAGLRARRLLPRLTLFTSPILWASLLLKPFGTDQGGMTVHVTGRAQGKTVRRRWETLASGGDGPFIPAVPARAIVRKMSAIPPGARPCLSDLMLKEIEDAARGLAVEFAVSEEEAPALFECALGGEWQSLPASIQRLHSVYDIETYSGTAEVTRGSGLIARLAGLLLNFPQASESIPLTVTKTRVGACEIWERNFAGRIFRSRWSLSGWPGHAIERLMGIAVEAKLEAAGGSLRYVIRRAWFAGVPLPAWLAPKAQIREYDEDGVFRFDVALYAPLTGGLIVRYRGEVA
jgi:saccharopine dehydrogenase-like NADP-dependent oxidoreductase